MSEVDTLKLHLKDIEHVVAKYLLLLKKADKVHSFWTTDGKIYARKENGSNPIKLSPSNNEDAKLGINERSWRSCDLLNLH